MNRVVDFVAARVDADELVCVALSGGRDSVALLHALVEAGWAPRLTALHVHHGLSARADDWAAFCVRLGETLGVPVRIARVRVETRGEGLEAAARAARYEAFAACGTKVLLLAHHRDDQAETLLFNLLRGCGIAGAAAMPAERSWAGVRFLRPLLRVGRAEVDAYAEERRLRWIEDESNADRSLSRNYLRHEIFPLLEARFPGAAERLAAASARFAEADVLLGEQAAQDWQRLARGEALPLASLAGMGPERVANLLRWRLRQLGWQPPGAPRLAEFVRQLRTAAPGKRPEISLPGGVMAVRRRVLRWLPHA